MSEISPSASNTGSIRPIHDEAPSTLALMSDHFARRIRLTAAAMVLLTAASAGWLTLHTFAVSFSQTVRKAPGRSAVRDSINSLSQRIRRLSKKTAVLGNSSQTKPNPRTTHDR